MLAILAERMGERMMHRIGDHTVMPKALSRGRTMGIGGDHAQTSTPSTGNKPRTCTTRAITTRMGRTTATTRKHFRALKFNGRSRPTPLRR